MEEKEDTLPTDILEPYDEMDDENMGVRILREQIDLEVTKLKDKKDRGIDDIPAELIKAGMRYTN